MGDGAKGVEDEEFIHTTGFEKVADQVVEKQMKDMLVRSHKELEAVHAIISHIFSSQPSPNSHGSDLVLCKHWLDLL